MIHEHTETLGKSQEKLNCHETRNKINEKEIRGFGNITSPLIFLAKRENVSLVKPSKNGNHHGHEIWNPNELFTTTMFNNSFQQSLWSFDIWKQST